MGFQHQFLPEKNDISGTFPAEREKTSVYFTLAFQQLIQKKYSNYSLSKIIFIKSEIHLWISSL